MNVRVAEEYKGFGDLASGLRVFVEQLKCKSGSFNEYVEQIDNIEKQVTEFEAVVSMLDKYVVLLESRVQSVYQNKIHLPIPQWCKNFTFHDQHLPCFLVSIERIDRFIIYLAS